MNLSEKLYYLFHITTKYDKIIKVVVKNSCKEV